MSTTPDRRPARSGTGDPGGVRPGGRSVVSPGMTGWLDRVRGLLGTGAATGPTRASGGPTPLGARGARVAGDPPSANGASSSHLFWDLRGELVGVSATLEVSLPPMVPRLYFWALQASF